jgi:hypothetical protein
LISNINACQAVADAVRTTLGPRGMDKLVFDGRKVTISNDGATIMKLLEIAHPAAKTLVDISMSQVSKEMVDMNDYCVSIITTGTHNLHPSLSLFYTQCNRTLKWAMEPRRSSC